MLRSLLVAAVVVGSVVAAGHEEPFMIRSVVLDGVPGTGYYSVVEKGFRLVGGLVPNQLAASAPDLPVIRDLTHSAENLMNVSSLSEDGARGGGENQNVGSGL